MCAPLVSSVRRPQQRERGREGERAAKQERKEERAQSVDGTGMAWGVALVGPLGRLAGSLHLRTLRPSPVAVVVAFVPAI